MSACELRRGFSVYYHAPSCPCRSYIVPSRRRLPKPRREGHTLYRTGHTPRAGRARGRRKRKTLRGRDFPTLGFSPVRQVGEPRWWTPKWREDRWGGGGGDDRAPRARSTRRSTVARRGFTSGDTPHSVARLQNKLFAAGIMR